MAKRPRSPKKQLTREQSSTSHEVMEANAWVPDPMQLAQLAAQFHPRKDTAKTPSQALRQAWAFFADSVALCAELHRASPRELRDMYGNTPGIVHSGAVLRMIEQSGSPSKTLRLYPQRPYTDPVREFFGVQKARTVVDNITEYCLAHQEEDNGCPYDGILEESKGIENGETYHDLPLEFLKGIKDFKHQRKVEGGCRKHHPQPGKPLRIVVPDERDEEA